MLGKFLKKDPAGAKLPLGQRVLKGMFTSAVSITTGVLADNLYMSAFRVFSKKPELPTTDPE